MSELLTAFEHSTLTECEAVIERGLNTFVEVGNALLAIRESRLYRAEHGTFEGYCRERWGFSDSRARQLIGAAETVKNLTDLPVPPPTVESHAAALARVPEQQRAEVWQRVVEETDGKPTAAAIREAAVPPAHFPDDHVPVAFVPPQTLSPEEQEQRRREEVATDLLTDLILSLSQLSGSDEFDYYQPAIARPRPINTEMLGRAAEAVDKTRTTLTSKGML